MPSLLGSFGIVEKFSFEPKISSFKVICKFNEELKLLIRYLIFHLEQNPLAKDSRSFTKTWDRFCAGVFRFV